MLVMVSQKERKGEFIRTWSSISAGEVSSLLVQNQLRDQSPAAGIYKHPSDSVNQCSARDGAWETDAMQCTGMSQFDAMLKISRSYFSCYPISLC